MLVSLRSLLMSLCKYTFTRLFICYDTTGSQLAAKQEAVSGTFRWQKLISSFCCLSFTNLTYYVRPIAVYCAFYCLLLHLLLLLLLTVPIFASEISPCAAGQKHKHD